METLSGEWVVGLGLFVLLLALLWQAWFPGLNDSSPETDASAPRAASQPTAQPGRFDLPG